MTVLEQRFMDAAIAFFNRKHNEKSQFIELTEVFIPSGRTQKILVNKNNITEVSPTEDMVRNGGNSVISYSDMGSTVVRETYAEIKAML